MAVKLQGKKDPLKILPRVGTENVPAIMAQNKIPQQISLTST